MNATLYTLSALFLLALGWACWALAHLLRRPAHHGEAVLAERDRLAAEIAGLRERERDLTEALGAHRAQLAAEQALAQGRVEELAVLRGELADVRARAEAEAIARGRAEADLRERIGELQPLRDQLQQRERELSALRAEREQLRAEHAAATANLAHLHEARAETERFVHDAQQRLSAAFAELAGKAFAERGAQFEQNVRVATGQSRADIELLLKPFAEQLGAFRQRVDTLYGEEAKERAALSGAVNELKSLNHEMAAQAAALTRALKGNAKVRGDWGELMLESVLRGSGLEEGVHYDRQKSHTGEDGQRLQPDIVVRLPDDRRIVVDSKVNLIAWQEAMNADTPEQQVDALRRHAAALRLHVKDLGDRNYPKAVGDSALEITIAFVPIEGALSAALGADDALQTFAFDRKVVFASPNTLMAVLRVVERLWTRDRIQKQAIDISDAGGRVLDALTGFLADFDQVGSRLKQAGDAFHSARNRLSESNQAVIPRARRLVELGARGKKALAEELVPESPALALLSSLAAEEKAAS